MHADGRNTLEHLELQLTKSNELNKPIWSSIIHIQDFYAARTPKLGKWDENWQILDCNQNYAKTSFKMFWKETRWKLSPLSLSIQLLH